MATPLDSAEQIADALLREVQREAAAATLHSQLLKLADAAESMLLRMWDASEDFTPAGSLLWHSDAKLMLEATAQAAIDATNSYLSYTADIYAPDAQLIVLDAGTYALDPFDALTAELKAKSGFTKALAEARVTVQAVASHAVFSPARTALSFGYATDERHRYGLVSGWQRRLNPGACDWCMNLSSVVFDSAEDANFGHNNCKCFPFPADVIGDWNTKQRDAAGWDRDAERRFENRKQITRLKRQQATALKNSRNAAADYLTETDPARRERLSIREQEWETRAELYGERLRILQTGSHRIR